MKQKQNKVEEKFIEFYYHWVDELEENLSALNNVSKNPTKQDEIEALVSKLTTLHKAYYTAKWDAAHLDVLAFFAPVWLNPLENAYLWLTGWKPSSAFCLVETLSRAAGGTLMAMSEDQMRKIEVLRVKIRLEEGKMEREMERQQVAMASRPMVELAKLAIGVRNGGGEGGGAGRVEVALKSLIVGLERLMKAADCVRLKTLKGVLDVLSPLQCVHFLAANSTIVVQLRKWGNNV